MNSKNVAKYGLFAALALLFGYVEFLLPIPLLMPGMKLGLANVVLVVVLYDMNAKSAFWISIVRVILCGLLFQGLAGLLYSLAGTLCSLLVMTVLQKTKKCSIVGVSMAGGVFHNIGQILIAAAVIENIQIAYYLPVLLISGVITGMCIGIVAQICLKHIGRK